MEEVCELENSEQALQRVKANKGSPGVDGMTSKNYRSTEAAWARDWGTVAKRNLSTAAGATGGNPEAGRQRSAEVRHSLRAGPVRQRRVAGSAETLGPDVLRTQPRFPTGHSARQAVREAQQYIAEGHGWVVDLDLEKFSIE